jgi:Tfp pilus assembly protein PilN
MTDRNSLTTLKQKATNLGLTPYASIFGDRRRRTTWENLLQSVGELTPLPERQIETSDHAQINWKLAIALLVGASALILLLQPLCSKGFSIKITIQIGTEL